MPILGFDDLGTLMVVGMSVIHRAQRAQSEMRLHWCAVLACFVTAVFAWGFGFYGQSVYLLELHRIRGWSSFLISSATTTFTSPARCW
jgi:hypothetical protein